MSISLGSVDMIFLGLTIHYVYLLTIWHLYNETVIVLLCKSKTALFIIELALDFWVFFVVLVPVVREVAGEQKLKCDVVSLAKIFSRVEKLVI